MTKTTLIQGTAWTVGVLLLIEHFSTFAAFALAAADLETTWRFPTATEKYGILFLVTATLAADVVAAYCFVRLLLPRRAAAGKRVRLILQAQCVVMALIILSSMVAGISESNFLLQFSASRVGTCAMGIGYVIAYEFIVFWRSRNRSIELDQR